jgi:hypothetical protein
MFLNTACTAQCPIALEAVVPLAAVSYYAYRLSADWVARAAYALSLSGRCICFHVVLMHARDELDGRTQGQLHRLAAQRFGSGERIFPCLFCFLR